MFINFYCYVSLCCENWLPHLCYMYLRQSIVIKTLFLVTQNAIVRSVIASGESGDSYAEVKMR